MGASSSPFTSLAFRLTLATGYNGGNDGKVLKIDEYLIILLYHDMNRKANSGSADGEFEALT
jgi:hypothetical protein